MEQGTELRRAYATLGISEDATLEDARAAYATWSMLLAELTVTVDGAGAELASEPVAADGGTQALLARHELDLAWYAIEQAHIDGALFVRRARGCSECGRTPAVRVTLFSVRAQGLRTRRVTISALVCRDCGLDACARVQGDNLRRGWWGALAPLHNLRAIVRNGGERRFLRRIDSPAVRRPALPIDGDLYAIPRRRLGARLLALITGLAAIALIVGLAVPVASGEAPAQQPERSTQSK